jgi:hypothetical protein
MLENRQAAFFYDEFIRCNSATGSLLGISKRSLRNQKN